jgi:hypothetical protein
MIRIDDRRDPEGPSDEREGRVAGRLSFLRVIERSFHHFDVTMVGGDDAFDPQQPWLGWTSRFLGRMRDR